MKTPEEIKKGLETCVSEDGTCDDCPYAMEFKKDLYVCYSTKRAAMADALAYIQQLEAQVTRMRDIIILLTESRAKDRTKEDAQ